MSRPQRLLILEFEKAMGELRNGLKSVAGEIHEMNFGQAVEKLKGLENLSWLAENHIRSILSKFKEKK